ncbi:MAG: serine/threonine-protein kinase [Gemmataceae bacterium]
MSANRQAGDEPVPGYVLVEPLGRGGFGEVWKCVAPGGLHKAVKFVPGGGDQLRQEAAAFERVRALRHAFLLSLERVELIGGDLVMVMELADAQLQDRFDECRRRGRCGIPRDELLRYVADAAEALDVIAARYGLQHLDVKPANLFLIDGHVKVGDYGLVRALGAGPSDAGLTPKYAAPEVLRGSADARSDQYSLALVYYELLTGAFPYPGRTAQQLMLQHMSRAPDLTALPATDRAAVGRALAKEPADRFPSCSDFVRAVATAGGGNPGSGVLSFPTTVPDLQLGAETRPAPVSTVVTPPPAETRVTPRAPAAAPADLPVVAFVPRLRPRPGRAGDQSAAEFIEAVVAAARYESAAGEPAPDGTRSCRFLSTTSAAVLPAKLAGVARQFGMTVEAWESGAVLRRQLGAGGRGSAGAAAGELWVLVQRAEPSPETVATAGLAGTLTAADQRTYLAALPGVLAAVRGAVETLRDRRAHPRYAVGLPVRLHPVGADGSVGATEDGVCEDVSAGGVRILTRAAASWRRVYLEFRSIEGVAGNALLATVVRSGPGSGGHLIACRFMG